MGSLIARAFALVMLGAMPQLARALPSTGLGAGTRALKLELDRASGRVVLGDHVDQLAAPVLSATIADGQVVFGIDLGTMRRAPTRWSITLARVNRAGVTVVRELPIIGHGLPPVAVPSPVPLAGGHLRAELQIDFGRFDGATSAVVFVPRLPDPLPARASVATLAIDGREARLPIGSPQVTFDLDVPAAVTLRIEDERGARWMRRSISASEVTRPTRRTRASPVRLDRGGEALRVATAVVPVTRSGIRVRAAGIEADQAWAQVAADHSGVAWRVTFGWDDGQRVSRFGVGRPPERIDVPLGAASPAWVRAEQSHPGGTLHVSSQVPLSGATTGPDAMAWVIPAESVAGQLVRVGTSTGAQVWVAVPEDL